jgi:hypothetical protein
VTLLSSARCPRTALGADVADQLCGRGKPGLVVLSEGVDESDWITLLDHPA